MIQLLIFVVVVTLAASAHGDVAKHTINIAPVESGDSPIQPATVAVTSDGSHLTVVFDAGQDIREYLLNNQASSMAEIWIDTDNDTSTGGKPFFSDIGGFEFSVDRVYVCKGGGGNYVCAGDLTMDGLEFTEFYSSYSPQRWDAASEDMSDIYDAFWDGGKRDLDGQKAIVKIPYEEIPVSAGQVVRILVLAGTSSGNKFPEVLLQLK